MGGMAYFLAAKMFVFGLGGLAGNFFVVKLLGFPPIPIKLYALLLRFIIGLAVNGFLPPKVSLDFTPRRSP